ncbi:hypothetical protein Tcan_01022, partial [Toxocara canis]
MTRTALFVAFLLYGFAVVAPHSLKECSGNCSFVVTTAEKDLRDLLRRVDDDFVQNQRSNENGVGGVVAILTLTNEAVAKAVQKRSKRNAGSAVVKQSKVERVSVAAMYKIRAMVKKNCTIEPNVSRHYFHAIKNDRGAILYSFIPMPREEYERQGYERTQKSTYYMRRNMCSALCTGTHVVSVRHHSEIEPLRQIFNAYNIQVPPVDPKLRQFNVGFWFQ